MMKEIKIWGGLAFLVIAIVVAFFLYKIASETQKNANFQLVSSQCVQQKDIQYKACQQLLDFGVAPSMYLINQEYRAEIDKKVIKQLESGPIIAGKLAKFTIEQAGNMQVKLAKNVIVGLKEKIQPTL
ncbi:hypothetical protein [Aliivibrio fischeri]|uniref:hypothetical protein n=1 Tax=Aliivibrio fischeri TaxID=668 RepID=UPI0012DABEE1|nr:hypothetical protein [Aliivibrio fischeri]MUK70310.1 hypothetical protein [Aliivibrio fischeri]MUK72026.1 hypothetical protein [Aliivibrio fischeri]